MYRYNMTSVNLISYADNAEDVVLMRAFRGRPGGVFADVGAGHPVIGSHTRNLITAYGWTGLHVEPNPALAAVLREHYPDQAVAECIAGKEAGTAVLHLVVDEWSLSTADSEMAERARRDGRSIAPLEVRVATLDSLLAESGIPPEFQVLKIDVEGAEDEVFAGLTLDHWRPEVIIAEATVPMSREIAHRKWPAMLARSGYSLKLFDGLNQFWLRDTSASLAADLSVPANVFDQYIPYCWYLEIDPERRPKVVSGT